MNNEEIGSRYGESREIVARLHTLNDMRTEHTQKKLLYCALFHAFYVCVWLCNFNSEIFLAEKQKKREAHAHTYKVNQYYVKAFQLLIEYYTMHGFMNVTIIV